MKKTKIVLACLAVALIGNSTVLAGNRPCAVTFTLADGYYHFDAPRRLSNDWVPNIAIGYDFDRNWGMEAGVGLINTNTNSCPSCGPSQSVHGFLYTIDGLYHFSQF